MIFHYDCIFNNIPREKKFPKSFRQWKQKNFLVGKNCIYLLQWTYCMKKKKAFLAKSESKGYWCYQVLLIVRGTYIYMVVMESFIVMSVYGLQIVINVIKSLSDVHPYLYHRYWCWNGQSVSIDIYAFTGIQVFLTFCFIFAVSRCRDSCGIYFPSFIDAIFKESFL